MRPIARFVAIPFLLLTTRMTIAQQSPPAALASSPTAEDRSAIVATIQHYFRAGDTGSSAELRAGFDPMAMMFSVTPAGQVVAVTQATWQQRLDANRSPVAASERRIDWIRATGNGAAAKLTSTFATFQFIDYVLLLETNGRWQIVGKVFHRRDPVDASLNADASADRQAIEALLAGTLRAVDVGGSAAFAELAHEAGTGSVVAYALLLRTGDGWRTFNLSYHPTP